MRALIARWLMPAIERALADAIDRRAGLLSRALEKRWSLREQERPSQQQRRTQ